MEITKKPPMAIPAIAPFERRFRWEGVPVGEGGDGAAVGDGSADEEEVDRGMSPSSKTV